MTELLQQYWPIAAAGALLVFAFLPKDLLGTLRGMVPATTPATAQPAVKASDATDPATLCEQASSIWRQRGDVELATKASAVAIESAKKEGGA